MIDLESSVEIDRPAAEVFDFVADQTNAPRWQSGLNEVRRLTDGAVGVGTEHEFVRVFAGRRLASRNRFVEFEPGRHVAFEIPAGWITGRASYLVEAGAPERTVLTSRMQFHVRGVARVIEPILGRILARDARRDQARLRELLHREGTAAATAA